MDWEARRGASSGPDLTGHWLSLEGAPGMAGRLERRVTLTS